MGPRPVAHTNPGASVLPMVVFRRPNAGGATTVVIIPRRSHVPTSEVLDGRGADDAGREQRYSMDTQR